MESEIIYDDVEYHEVVNWALFSGGHDSLVSTHYLMENGYTEAVLHLDTQTGLDENKQFVKDICDKYGWGLRIQESPIGLRELALEIGEEPYGFPGPQFHSIAYRYLKERSLRAVVKGVEGKPHFWTGVRRDESDRRMQTVTDAVKETDRWVWHAPLRNWTRERMDEYIDEQDLPRNPVVENIHRSGECYCGAFGHRDEELIDLQANYPEHYEWLMEIEDEVIDVLGEDDDNAYWAHGNLTDSEKAHLKAARDRETDMMLCRDCKVEQQNPGSETDW